MNGFIPYSRHYQLKCHILWLRKSGMHGWTEVKYLQKLSFIETEGLVVGTSHCCMEKKYDFLHSCSHGHSEFRVRSRALVSRVFSTVIFTTMLKLHLSKRSYLLFYCIFVLQRNNGNDILKQHMKIK